MDGKNIYEICDYNVPYEIYEIIEDVTKMRSEIGLLFLNDFNEAVLKKEIAEEVWGK